LCGTLLALAAMVSPAAEPTSGPAFAARVFERINEVRQARGLEPLEHDPRLEALALEHSLSMVEQGRPSHDGFQGRFARVPASKLCVENVAAGYTQPRPLVDGWQAAPAHRQNLFEPRVRWLGVASAGRYVTMFACS
jgi:uncharacterized protein YkwD